jgi:UDP-N-acetylmuramoylalanine--D-glutamate ligase
VKKTDKIAVLGFGVEGRAMCEYLLKHGYRDVIVCDQNANVDGVPSEISARLGPKYLTNLGDFDIVFRSPGISFFRPEIQELLGSQTVVSSMTKYFFEHCPVPIVGVTGTKGKGTTASLITEILRQNGRKVFLGGNIGVPAVSFLDDLSEDGLVVLELSSFQLVDLEVSPHVAVVLNVTSEHLDYHSSIMEYHESKYPIMKFQGVNDVSVLNRDYPYAEEFAKLGEGKKLFVSSRNSATNDTWIDGARGVDAGLHWNDESDPDPRERGSREFMKVREFGLLGRHNWENILSATTVARYFGVDHFIIESVLRQFTGLPHRLEKIDVGGCGNINFYNDSFSTTPEACIAACSAFEDMGKPFFLIAGGSEKGSSFTVLGWKLSQMKFLQKVFLMGPSGVRIGEAISDGFRMCTEDGTICREKVPSEMVENLSEAMHRAVDEAKKLDEDAVILMSPAAASFNEFKNYKERGGKFRELAKKTTSRS